MKTRVSIQHEPRRKLPWCVRWWGFPDPDAGKQKRFGQSFVHNREAQAFQVERQAETGRGEYEEAQADVTLGELLDRFEKARLKPLSYSSKVCYGNTMTQLRHYFKAGRALRTIRQEHAEAFIATRARVRGGGELSGHARRQHVKLARAIFNAALEWGFVERNPFRPANPRTNSALKVRTKTRPWHHLTPDQFGAMMAVVPSVRRRAAYWFMYGCGLRPGEVYNLAADRIDLVERTVRVENRLATEDLPPFHVKADDRSDEGKERVVPIPAAALQDIAEAMKGAFASGGLVILEPGRFTRIRENWRSCRRGEGWAGHGPRPWQNCDMLNNLLRDTRGYIKRVGIKLDGVFTLHSLRKSFGQNHADAGTPPRTLADLLGHSDVKVTMEFYQRVTDANRQQAARTMDGILGRIGAGRAVRPVSAAV